MLPPASSPVHPPPAGRSSRGRAPGATLVLIALSLVGLGLLGVSASADSRAVESVLREAAALAAARRQLAAVAAHAAVIERLTPEDQARLAAALPGGPAPDSVVLAAIASVVDGTQGVTLSQVSRPALNPDSRSGELEGISPRPVTVSLSVPDYGRLKQVLVAFEGILPLFDLERLTYDPAVGVAELKFQTYQLEL